MNAARMIRQIAAALLAGGLVVGAVALDQGDAMGEPVVEVIHEDDVRWDCLTMGNLVCGPGADLNPTVLATGDVLRCRLPNGSWGWARNGATVPAGWTCLAPMPSTI